MTSLMVRPGAVRELQEQQVREEIHALFRSRSGRAARYGSHVADLWQAAAECVLGGKLLRPRLLLDALDALRSTGARADAVQTSAVRIAAAVEMLHYAFLLHDDVIDSDLWRRGRPNLIGTLLSQHGKGNPLPSDRGALTQDRRRLHWARSGAILMGDLLLSEVHQVFAREHLPERIRLRLLDLLDHTITESIAGEHLDVALSDGMITPEFDSVLAMTRLKTASYTFELPLRAAAILAGSTPRTEEVLGDVGTLLGSAFQLQDDLLSTFGEAGDHGKDAYSDLREGKETVIIAHARRTSAWPEVQPHFGNPQLSTADAVAVRHLLGECGAEEFVRSLIADQLTAARVLATSAESGLPAGVRSFLTTLTAMVEGRRS